MQRAKAMKVEKDGMGKAVKPTQVKGGYEDAKLDAEAVVPSVLIQIKLST